MISTLVNCLIGHEHDAVSPSSTREGVLILIGAKKRTVCKPRLIHHIAPWIDVLLGLSVLVLGILNLMAPHLGIGLSSAAQWALIGAGSIYVCFVFAKMGVVAYQKHCLGWNQHILFEF